MSIAAVLDLLRCPVCTQPWADATGSIRCPAGHSFDLARQGHLNLLGRAAPHHADSADMVAARGRFLAAGHYDPISGAVYAAVADQRSAGSAPTLLEVGAGTGHYLSRLHDRTGGRAVALDISAAACRRAARDHPELGVVVADAWAPLPLADAAFDVVLSVFAPRQPAEFARVLQPGGVLVVVAPLTDHLVELRTALGLLDIDADKQSRLRESLVGQFVPGPTREHRAVHSWDAATLLDLVTMGPNAFHQDPATLAARIAALNPPLSVTVAVTVSTFRHVTAP